MTSYVEFDQTLAAIEKLRSQCLHSPLGWNKLCSALAYVQSEMRKWERAQ